MSSGAIDEYKDDFEDYEDDVDDAVEFQSRAPRLVSTLEESFTACLLYTSDAADE